MLEELCKTLSELELRAYLGGKSSGSDHVITTDDIDDEKELELLLSPSKNANRKDSGSNRLATRSLNIQNDYHLGNKLGDVNTIATINQIKVCMYISMY